MAKKFVVAMMMHETNTFSPLPTPIDSFARAGALAGPAAIKESEGTNTSLGGFIEVARKAGAEFTVPMAASAHPSGLVTKAAYEQMTTAIVDEVKKGCDAVLLALHGAMVAEHYDDGEGELLNRIRKIAPDVPIAVALDFHTQMTDAMIKGATIITGYRTYPHIDMADTARRAGRTLMRMLAGEVEPKMVWGNRPIMSSSLVHTPSREPMKTLMGMANQAEDTGQVLNASVFGGFPQADIPHLALSSVIVCDKRTAEGEILLNKILDTAWEKREGFLFHPEPLSVQVARAKSLDGGPVVMADHGDNTASGGTQDVMSVIEEAMKQGLEDACRRPDLRSGLRRADDQGRRRQRGDARARRQDRHAGDGAEGQAAQGQRQGQGDHRRPASSSPARWRPAPRCAWAAPPCSTPARCRSWSPRSAPSPTTSASSPIAASIRGARSTC